MKIIYKKTEDDVEEKSMKMFFKMVLLHQYLNNECRRGRIPT